MKFIIIDKPGLPGADTDCALINRAKFQLADKPHSKYRFPLCYEMISLWCVCVHVRACAVYVCSCLWRLKEGIRSSGARVIDSCEPSHMGTGN